MNNNIVITENDKKFIHKHKWDNTSIIKKGETTDLVIIKCLHNKEIEIKTTDKITFNIKNENRIEIPDTSKIGIKKVHPSVGIWIISRITYYDLRTGYSFRQNVMINDRQYIQIWIANSEVDIPKENISFKIEACLTESE